MVKAFEQLFPRLRGDAYQVTSPADAIYNCIAWAAGSVDIWWWPIGDPERVYWPEGAPRVETVVAFRAAFATLGYVDCDHAESELGYEKIALFASAKGVPTHAARQLASGRWTSKIGQLEDIEHFLQDLEGTAYGSVSLVMKRPFVETFAGDD
jgi:hypothetical protein